MKDFKNILLKKAGTQPLAANPSSSGTFNAIVSRYKEGKDQATPKKPFLSPLKAPKTTIEGAARLTCGLLYDLLCMDFRVIAKFETSLHKDLIACMTAIYALRGKIKMERELLRGKIEREKQKHGGQ